MNIDINFDELNIEFKVLNIDINFDNKSAMQCINKYTAHMNSMSRPGMDKLAKRLTRGDMIRVRVPIGAIFTTTKLKL